MKSAELKLQIQLLQLQIDLEESNYIYAVELHKDYDILRRMRDNIRNLKDHLHFLLKEETHVSDFTK